MTDDSTAFRVLTLAMVLLLILTWVVHDTRWAFLAFGLSIGYLTGRS